MSKPDHHEDDRSEQEEATVSCASPQVPGSEGTEGEAEFNITVRKLPAKVQARGVLAE